MIEKKPGNMKNLTIVMAGDSSLHGEYCINRDFELWTIYYGSSDETFERYRSISDRIWRRKGLKIELVRRVLLEELHFGGKFDFSAYDFVFLPDDDIRFPNGAADISRLFETCRDLSADVFQPAVSNGFYSSGWESTRLMPDFVCHRTNIVEVMMHGFSGRALAKAYLPAVHAMQFIKSGWGIESIWMKIGEAVFQRPLRTFVIDAVPAIHTRPLGSEFGKVHAIGIAEAHLVPQYGANWIHTMESFVRIADAAAIPDESVAPAIDIPIHTRHKFVSELIWSFNQLVKSVSPRTLIEVWRWVWLRMKTAAPDQRDEGLKACDSKE